MNNMKFMLLLVILFVSTPFDGIAQVPNYQRALKAPGLDEKLLGSLSSEKVYQRSGCANGCSWGTKEDWYNELLLQARLKYPSKLVDIRQMIPTTDDGTTLPWKGPVRCIVVDLSGNEGNNATNSDNTESTIENALSRAMEKSLRNLRDGSRVAIDNVNVTGTTRIDRDYLKDLVIDGLLEQGLKVVAKEYLERLYSEQQNQQSGIYNDRTTVQENNFTAVGYYINVKVTATTLRVQVINVSTGEYEGNVTIKLQE